MWREKQKENKKKRNADGEDKKKISLLGWLKRRCGRHKKKKEREREDLEMDFRKVFT